LGNSLSWTEESARFLFIWIIVLGASIGIKEGFHVSIVIVKEKLKGKAKNILYMGINISILIFSIVLVTSGIKLLNSVNGQLSPAIRLNMLWVYLSIPVSGTFIIIHVISEIIKNIFQLKEV
jgi:TRAP-type C4-dicarboxylate transport system permease small subunit